MRALVYILAISIIIATTMFRLSSVSFIIALIGAYLMGGAVAVNNVDAPLSTGQFLTLGTQDPNWSASYQGAKPTVTYANMPSTYWKQFSNYANWITPPIVSGTSDSGNFTFTTSFDLMKYDPATYVLNADIATDDALLSIAINKKPVTLKAPCTKNYQYFECLVSYQFTGSFISGTNTIDITVNNVGGVLNPVGLYVKFGI